MTGDYTTEPAKSPTSFIAMKKFLIVFFLLTSLLSIASAATEQEIVDRSAKILRTFRSMPEKGIPPRVLRNARGLAILSVVKVGFGFSGKGGEGVVVARTGDGWSGLRSSEQAEPELVSRSARS